MSRPKPHPCKLGLCRLTSIYNQGLLLNSVSCSVLEEMISFSLSINRHTMAFYLSVNWTQVGTSFRPKFGLEVELNAKEKLMQWERERERQREREPDRPRRQRLFKVRLLSCSGCRIDCTCHYKHHTTNTQPLHQ